MKTRISLKHFVTVCSKLYYHDLVVINVKSVTRKMKFRVAALLCKICTQDGFHLTRIFWYEGKIGVSNRYFTIL